MDQNFTFGHERLDCYRLAREVAEWAARQVFPAERRHLRDQLVRAADSAVLNIAEGSGKKPGASRRNYYSIALGSAAEACAVLDPVRLPEGPARQEQLRRVGAMLTRLSRG
jgi:four helix bundle protein